MQITQAKSSRTGFTLVEIMIVVAIIALLATIAVPSFLRARKRAQATKVLNGARLLDAAVDQWAIEANQTDGATADWGFVKPFVKDSSLLYKNDGKDIFGNPYVDEGGDLVVTVGEQLTVNKDTYDALSDVTDDDFWGSYLPTY
jgi:prepilin-type N-terminal cleavage/methylation domain-containing protein